MRWPEKNYIHCERFGFLYIPIEKVACSALKAWVIELNHGVDVSNSVDVHTYTRTHYALRRVGRRQAIAALNDPRLFRFAFVRNPWDRLVSAYLNKFVTWKSPADRFIREASSALRRRKLMSRFTLRRSSQTLPRLGWPEAKNTLTFRTFVDVLSQLNAARFDYHWRPQSLFLGPREPDFVGRFECLDEDFQALGRRLGLACHLRTANRTHRGDVARECLADWPLEQLRTLPRFPGFAAFYTTDLIDAVATIYRADVERFGYEFRRDPAEGTVHLAAG